MLASIGRWLAAFLTALQAAVVSDQADAAKNAAPAAATKDTAMTIGTGAVTFGQMSNFVSAIRAVNISEIEGVLTAIPLEQKVADALLGVEDVAAILAAVDVPGAGEVEFASEVLGWLLANGGLKGATVGVSQADGGYVENIKTGRGPNENL